MAYKQQDVDFDWLYRGESINHLMNRKGVQDSHHPGLMLDRFVPYGTDRTKPQNQQKREFALSDRPRRVWLDEVCHVNIDANLLKAQRSRWEEMVGRGMFGAMQPIALQTASRLIVGLGAEHALETAITLDRSSGAPVIPGSALKGVARTFALIGIAQQLQFTDQQIETALNTLDNWLSAEKLKRATLNEYGLRDLNDEKREKLFDSIKLFRLIFGCVAEIGRVIFFNGIYHGDKNPFEVDVMTPHFSSYYTTPANRPAPSDDQNPVPITYLVVQANQKFDFAVGARTAEDVDLAKVALEYLEKGLIEYGVGAKTAQGYGVFRKLPQKG